MTSWCKNSTMNRNLNGYKAYYTMTLHPHTLSLLLCVAYLFSTTRLDCEVREVAMLEGIKQAEPATRCCSPIPYLQGENNIHMCVLCVKIWVFGVAGFTFFTSTCSGSVPEQRGCTWSSSSPSLSSVKSPATSDTKWTTPSLSSRVYWRKKGQNISIECSTRGIHGLILTIPY